MFFCLLVTLSYLFLIFKKKRAYNLIVLVFQEFQEELLEEIEMFIPVFSLV